MVKKTGFFGVLLHFFVFTAGAQMQNFKEFPVPAGHSLQSHQTLPPRLDNSQLKFFPEIMNQYGWSCNQASSIGYVMTYEMNCLRDLDSKVWENHYAPLFPWNFMNWSSAGTGVSYFDTWEIVKAAGCPTYAEFPVYSDTRVWMSGYENYYQAMQNRVIHNYSIHVGTEAGLLKLKNFLFDHANGSAHGGIANIQIASGSMTFRNAPEDSPDPGAPVIVSFGELVGHALTIVGYDDAIGYDVNGDGRITNDVDINDDGKIDLKDREMGAVIVANTWGKSWGREGKSYVLYRVLAHDGHQGGIWNESVHVVQAVKEYHPLLTLKVVMDHTARNRFSLLAGFSSDTTADQPEHVMGFPMFNYQGDATPLFSDDPADSTRFEFGLDISSLTSHLSPDEPVKFFFMVDEKDPTDAGQGTIRSVSLINYAGEVLEYAADLHNVPIQNDTVTYVPIPVDRVDYDPLQIRQEAAQSIPVGESVQLQLDAEGGTPPYLWELVRTYEESHFERPFPEVSGDTLLTRFSEETFVPVDLPFRFPYYDEAYGTVIVDRHGAIHFNGASLDYPYAIDTDLRFLVRKSLIPFGRELRYVSAEDQVCYTATDSVVRFIFDATVQYQEANYDIQFATYLYADGRIEFHYGNFEQPPGGMYSWLTGISAGDGENYAYASINELGILFQNYGVCFAPSDYPGSVSLSDDGMLVCTPDAANRIWNILVRVRDKNNQKKTGAIPISTVIWEQEELLDHPMPNPFSGVTTLSFKIPSEQTVRLVIYDVNGRLVKHLLHTKLLAGEHQIHWNGTDYANRMVVPGVYFCRLEIAEGFDIRRIVKME